MFELSTFEIFTFGFSAFDVVHRKYFKFFKNLKTFCIYQRLWRVAWISSKYLQFPNKHPSAKPLLLDLVFRHSSCESINRAYNKWISVCYYCILIFLQLEEEISSRHGKQEKIDDGESFSFFIWWRKNLLTQFIHFRSTCLPFISSPSLSLYFLLFPLIKM